MARIVIAGAGVCGLAAGLMLQRDGHDVTVLERDPAPLPDSPGAAWERWERAGVTQFRMAHYLQPLGHGVLRAELPDVLDALAGAGAPPFDALCMMPPPLAAAGPRDGDARFMTLATRRTTLELAFARVAEEELDFRRGVGVEALLGEPHVRGVRTDTGEELPADLVVDAMGRRSPLPKLLSRPAHEEGEDSGFLYYGRHFRGTPPQVRAPINMPVGTISILTLPGDCDTWSVTIYTATGDQPLKRLREPDRFTALVASLPLHAHWLDGEPITDVTAMGGIVDRYRRLPDGVTGLALLADAFACTNPSLGRGISLGIRHAQLLRDAAREEDPVRFAAAFDTATEAEVAPWYRDTVAIDRARLAEVEALRDGRPGPRPANPVRAAIGPAAMRDPDVFRAMMAHRCCLGSPADLDAPELGERVLALTADAGPPRLAGPDREQLLALLA
jgi:2-polyprenyl-6-methoxyphenol hydroxylase-like FAD-dependent oxidoreductase